LSYYYFYPIFSDKIHKFNEYWILLTAFDLGIILAPKFQAATKEGEKLFMSWLFVKGIKEIG